MVFQTWTPNICGNKSKFVKGNMCWCMLIFLVYILEKTKFGFMFSSLVEMRFLPKVSNGTLTLTRCERWVKTKRTVSFFHMMKCYFIDVKSSIPNEQCRIFKPYLLFSLCSFFDDAKLYVFSPIWENFVFATEQNFRTE